jgi:hypothetical protein
VRAGERARCGGSRLPNDPRRGCPLQFIGSRHDALMTLYRTRFSEQISEQIEIIKAEEPSVWRETLVMKRRLPDRGTKGRRIHSSLQLFPNNAGRF